MFRRLGRIVSRGWPFMLLLWPLLGLVLGHYSPHIDEVTTVGPGFSLPEGYDSRTADDLLDDAFSRERSRLIVLMSSGTPLTEADHQLIHDLFETEIANPAKHPLVAYYLSPYTHKYIERRLSSLDGKTVMVVVILKGQFTGLNTYAYVEEVEGLLDDFTEAHPHLSYNITDSAAIGRDYNKAAKESLDRTRVATVLLVVTILVILYRSPVTPIVPLLTIALSLYVATSVMALLGKGVMEIPKLVPIYMVVILFGSCTDYCLFLIGRFREEMARGRSRFDAVGTAITHVGEAVTASALTTIAGLSMMVFASFAIFRTTGPALGIGLAVGLLAALTFAPALMVILGKRLFWPVKIKPIDAEKTRAAHVWDWLARIVVRRPGLVLMIAILAFAPLAAVGSVARPSYDLFRELPPGAPSVRGHSLIMNRTKFDQTQHSEQLVLVMKSAVNFRKHQGLCVVEEISMTFDEQNAANEIRSITRPIGKVEPALDQYISEPHSTLRYATAMPVLLAAFPTYVSKDGSITRINIVLRWPSFSPRAIETPEKLKPVVRAALERAGLPEQTFHFTGVSAQMGDVAKVTRHDLRKLRWMVLGVLYVILSIMLRGAIAPIYLLATMVFNYFTALGITQLIFVRLLGKPGLDWKVEFFLFVLLVAIGVDYNIYIMSRLREERKRRTFRESLRHAIVFTGSIISSCGIIMAGTFGSMTLSTLAMMMEIGTAMAIGVLLDTFIVRPLVVPSFALLVERLKEKLRGGTRKARVRKPDTS